jgi:hypothetical protein
MPTTSLAQTGSERHSIAAILDGGYQENNHVGRTSVRFSTTTLRIFPIFGRDADQDMPPVFAGSLFTPCAVVRIRQG